MKDGKSTKSIALKVAVVTLIINAALTVFKFLAGFFGHSKAMISDAVHSSSDVISTIIVIIGLNVANKKPDKLHPYGHERFECVASIILAAILFGTGAVIGYTGITTLINKTYSTTPPTVLALSAAIASIVIKEGMFWYTYIYAKKINSVALKASAWDHRSDALSSIGSMIGIIGAMLSVYVLDTIASLVICILIIKAALDIFREAVGKMVDKSCDDKTVKAFESTALSVDGVLRVDEIKTRMFGNKIYVDMEIGVYKNLTLEVAHRYAERVHDLLERTYPDIKHCQIHVNPVDVKELDATDKLITDNERLKDV